MQMCILLAHLNGLGHSLFFGIAFAIELELGSPFSLKMSRETMNTTDSLEYKSVQPAKGALYSVQQLWVYRGLLYYLVLRELKARYKNSVLGFLWSLLNPLGMMLVFAVVFGILRPQAEIERYPIFLLCGLLPWNYFSDSIMGSLTSISQGASLVKKVYFPREILPIAEVLSQLINFLLAFILLFAVLFIFRSNFNPWIWILLPLVIIIQTCFQIGIGLILSTLNVFYRDTAMVMNVAILAMFFLTPIFYDVDLLPQTTTLLGIDLPLRRIFYILNPMASIINLYRDLLYWGRSTDVDFFLRTATTAILTLYGGYWIFNRYAGRFGEEV